MFTTDQEAGMKWAPLTGRDAEIVTLEAKLDIARLRGETDAVAKYEARLNEIDPWEAPMMSTYEV